MCNDFDSCTIDTCEPWLGSSVCRYSPVQCSSCGTNIKVTATTNNYPNLLSWSIINTNINRIIMSSDSFLLPETTYDDSKCLQFGRYKFFLSYAMNDTTSNNVSYSLESENKIIDKYES